MEAILKPNMSEQELKLIDLKLQTLKDNTDYSDRIKIADLAGVNIAVVSMLLGEHPEMCNYATAQHIIDASLKYLREKNEHVPVLEEKNYAEIMAGIRKKLPKGSVKIISDKLDILWDSVYHAISRHDASPSRMDLIIDEAEAIIKTASNQTSLEFPELEFPEEIEFTNKNLLAITYSGVVYSEQNDNDKSKLAALFNALPFRRGCQQEIGALCGTHPSDVSKAISKQKSSYSKCLQILAACLKYFGFSFTYELKTAKNKITEEQKIELPVIELNNEKIHIPENAIVDIAYGIKNTENKPMQHRKSLKREAISLAPLIKFGDIQLLTEITGINSSTAGKFFKDDTLTRTTDAEKLLNAFKQILRERNEPVTTETKKRNWFQRFVAWCGGL